MQRERTCVLGDRSLEVGHGGEAIPSGDAIDLAIPRPTAKAVIKPFDGRARQPAFFAAQKLHDLPLEPAVIVPGVEHRSAGGRIESAIKAPQNLAYRVSAITQVKEITKNF